MLNELHDKFEYDHLVKLRNQIDDVLQKINEDRRTGFINHFLKNILQISMIQKLTLRMLLMPCKAIFCRASKNLFG